MVVGVRATRSARWHELVLCVLVASPVAAQAAPNERDDRVAEREWVQNGKEFWAFQPPQTPDVPVPADRAWPRGPVDRFILARLEAARLRPAAPASPRSLIRRLTFDLSGLPPSAAEIRAFVTDPTERAYDALVDRLLAAPAFGERWGRHWMDVARFAESSGGGRSLMFANAWHFRDYVIDSYNADRPFDEFVTEQIAGDLLPYETDAQRNRQLVASGFLELGPTNYEQQNKELLRMEVIDEQIDTVGRAFMGLTLGCARCHDHKFDPIPMRDYYALAGIFGSTQVLMPGNVSGYAEHEFLGTRTQKWHAYRKRITAIEAKLKKLRPARRAKPPRQIARAGLEGIVLDDEDARTTGVWIPSSHTPGYLDRGYIHDEDTEKGMKSVRFTPTIRETGVYEVLLSYTPGNNRATNTPVRIDHAEGHAAVRVDQRAPPDIRDTFVSLGRYRFAAGAVGAITISNEGTDGHVIVDALQLISAESGAATNRGPEPTAEAALADAAAEQRTRLEAELAQLKKVAPPKPERAMAVRDVEKPADGHLHSRGRARSLGPTIPRGFVTVCGGDDAPIPDGQSGRLQLARWLTDPSHPLTARVYVNRVWHHLFGTGLVRTTDNFGKKGELPSHPELLDWLARRFAAEGWSTKKLVREIVRSRAYRMRVSQSPATDTENRLLSHANRRRLDAESIRDAILAISGQLDPTRGGKTIRKMSQYDYAYTFASRRRSVYVPRFRSNRLEIFDVFDAADPNVVTGARNVSNVATQALYLMNSPWVMEQAKHAATRMLGGEDASTTTDDRIEEAHVWVLGRPPRAGEQQIARRHVASFGEDRQTAFASLFHALFACLDFRYLN